jgi:hypothetical protein
MISSPPLTDTELLLSYWAATGFEQVQLEPKLLVDLFYFYIL